jgi:hypothetical protein
MMVRLMGEKFLLAFGITAYAVQVRVCLADSVCCSEHVGCPSYIVIQTFCKKFMDCKLAGALCCHLWPRNCIKNKVLILLMVGLC